MDFENACPKCNSVELTVTDTSYPKAYECNKCNYSFIRGKQSLIDD